ncbi:hypothetical protein [Leifsonia xyli]|jgi:hypothetical protein|uniref:hypothetical protein n=1 Tax=Leifsonia xyli TaxID=1575 RepID=UPI00118712E7|nr:hypothetical protein [Leifsonia xyli]
MLAVTAYGGAPAAFADAAPAHSNHLLVRTYLDSATRGPNGITLTGWAQPGSRLKTTNDPNVGWFDPEGGNVYANADGSFTLVTYRLINGEAAVKSFDPKTGQAISESNHLPVTS